MNLLVMTRYDSNGHQRISMTTRTMISGRVPMCMWAMQSDSSLPGSLHRRPDRSITKIQPRLGRFGIINMLAQIRYDRNGHQRIRSSTRTMISGTVPI